MEGLPNELKWHIMQYVPEPTALVITNFMNRCKIEDPTLTCHKCDCFDCINKRSTPYQRFMYREYPAFFDILFSKVHSCKCHINDNSKNRRRVCDAWFSQWNNLKEKQICGLKKKPLLLTKQRGNDYVVNHVNSSEGVKYVCLSGGFSVNCIPPRCRVIQSVTLEKMY